LYVVKHRYYLITLTTVLPLGLLSLEAHPVVAITAETTKTASRIFFINNILI